MLQVIFQIHQKVRIPEYLKDFTTLQTFKRVAIF